MFRMLIVGCLAWLLGIAAERPVAWKDFNSLDGSVSLRYPADWTVAQNGPLILLKSISGGELINVALLPSNSRSSAHDDASAALAKMRSANPTLKVSNAVETRDSVSLDMTYSADGIVYKGLASVRRTGDQSVWCSYVTRATEYDGERGKSLLQSVLASVHAGTAESQPQTGAGNEVRSPLTGKWAASNEFYEFRGDGTYWYRMVGGGMVSRGAVTVEGRYSLDGAVLTLRATRES